MTTPTSQILGEIADREAIRECLYRYSHGLDSDICKLIKRK